MSRTILVTGARGTVGSALVELLAASGQRVRAAVRAPEKAAWLEHSVEQVAFDFMQPATFGPAFAGVEQLFLMRPPALSDVRRWIFPALAAAQAAGVQHIVLLSLLGAERLRVVPHYRIEQQIAALGFRYTFLRPSFFMQNLSTTHRLEIQEHDEIFVPAGRGKTSFVDARDVAGAAAQALTAPGQRNQCYALTGSEALTYAEAAAILSDTLGRRIVYRQPSLLRFITRQRATGTPPAMIAVMAGIYTTARLGLASAVTADTARILGRPPRTLAQFTADYRACWGKAAQA